MSERQSDSMRFKQDLDRHITKSDGVAEHLPASEASPELSHLPDELEPMPFPPSQSAAGRAASGGQRVTWQQCAAAYWNRDWEAVGASDSQDNEKFWQSVAET